MIRFIETVLLPRLTEVLVDDADEYTLTRTVISVYVETISDEPEIYQFVTGSKSASPSVMADSEKLIAEVVAFAMHARLGDRSIDTDGFQTWSYALVGGVQLATHWWMQEQSLPALRPRRPTDDARVDVVRRDRRGRWVRLGVRAS